MDFNLREVKILAQIQPHQLWMKIGFPFPSKNSKLSL